MEQRNYTLKECRAFSLERRDYIQQFVRGNFDPKAELPVVTIPDEPHPWNILHSVIEQFYNRECGIAQALSDARCDKERAQRTIKHNEESQEAYWRMQKEIGDLRQANERLTEILSRTEKSPQKSSDALLGLLQEASPYEWADSMGDILDGLIMSLDYSGCDALANTLSYARTLQRFFMELGKEMSPAEN